MFPDWCYWFPLFICFVLVSAFGAFVVWVLDNLPEVFRAIGIALS